MTLRDYLQTVVPTLRPAKAKRTIQKYQLAVNRLVAWMGREAMLEEVTPQLIERFRQVESHHAGMIRALLETHDATRFPLTRPGRRIDPTRRKERRPTSDAPNTSSWTVNKYLDEVYIPQKQEAGLLGAHAAAEYRRWARRLAEWKGREIRLRELTDALIAEAAGWLQSKYGLSGKTADNLQWSLKCIRRHWRPDEHPKTSTSHANLAFMEADIEGTLEQICRDLYFPENTKISSPSTIKQYGRCLRTFSMFLGHAATAADLTDLNIGRFLRHRFEAGVKARTANGEAKQLKALWNWMAKKRFVAQFPTVGKLPEPELVPKAWTREELDKLIAACKAQLGKIARIDAASWWYAFHLVLWDTGERTGAMLALTWTMLDFKTGHLTVPAEIRKGRQKAMVYRLKPATLVALRKIRSPERELIFPLGGKQAPPTLSRFYKRLVASAGLPWISHKTGPQKMRRTFASFITAAGGDATAALRHSTRRVTEESYNDPTIANPTAPNEVLFDLDAEGGAA